MSVRLALRCLWAHFPESWPLVVTFWKGAQQENKIGRGKIVTGSLIGLYASYGDQARIPNIFEG